MENSGYGIIGKVCSAKKCDHGGVKQPYSSFYKSKKSRDGYQSSCKDCLQRRRDEIGREKGGMFSLNNLIFGH